MTQRRSELDNSDSIENASLLPGKFVESNGLSLKYFSDRLNKWCTHVPRWVLLWFKLFSLMATFFLIMFLLQCKSDCKLSPSSSKQRTRSMCVQSICLCQVFFQTRRTFRGKENTVKNLLDCYPESSRVNGETILLIFNSYPFTWHSLAIFFVLLFVVFCSFSGADQQEIMDATNYTVILQWCSRKAAGK